jgi:hypothetical protein
MSSSRRYGGSRMLQADVPSAAKRLLHYLSAGPEGVTGLYGVTGGFCCKRSGNWSSASAGLLRNGL